MTLLGIPKNGKIAFWATFSTHSIYSSLESPWFLLVIIELFLLSPTVETLWAEICRSRRFSKRWVTFSAEFRGKGHRSPTMLVSENWSDCRFVWHQNIRSLSFSFVTIHASDGQTDGRTYRQTELLQQYCALHYMQSHGKSHTTAAFISLIMAIVGLCITKHVSA